MLHQKKMRSAVLARLLAQATALSSPYLQRPTPAGVARATTPVFAVLAEPIPKVPVWHPTAEGKEIAARENLPGLSGLNGMAMLVEKSDIPSKGAVRTAVPDHCYVKDTKRSLKYALISLVEGLACLGVGFLIPLKLAALPLWIAYAMVTGCVWTGAWVIAHECGHNAFSNNRFIQDAVGYFFHSLLLVPYFSWQHSHAVHHQFTNHITKGETHVPFVIGGKAGIELPGGEHMMDAARFMGKKLHGVMQVVFHLVFGVRARLECPTRAAPNCCPAASRLRPPPLTMSVGWAPRLLSRLSPLPQWPAYLLFGATGGPKYGLSNHFIPAHPFSKVLWPGNWVKKVWQSDIGVVAMLGFLTACARRFGAMSVMALYVSHGSHTARARHRVHQTDTHRLPTHSTAYLPFTLIPSLTHAHHPLACACCVLPTATSALSSLPTAGSSDTRGSSTRTSTCPTSRTRSGLTCAELSPRSTGHTGRSSTTSTTRLARPTSLIMWTR